jgi:hypothetical protein
MKTWHAASTGNHQGLVIEDETGRNVAVAYDKADAPLIAQAPAMLEALRTARAIVQDMIDTADRDNPLTAEREFLRDTYNIMENLK